MNDNRKRELGIRAQKLRQAKEALTATPHGHWLRESREADYVAAREALARMGPDGRRTMWAVVLA